MNSHLLQAIIGMAIVAVVAIAVLAACAKKDEGNAMNNAVENVTNAADNTMNAAMNALLKEDKT